MAWIYGLRECGFNEVLEIESIDGHVISAFALSLGENEIGAVLLGGDIQVRAGAKVSLTGRSLEVPVGPEIIGRVIDPLGRPLDICRAPALTWISPPRSTAPISFSPKLKAKAEIA